MKVTKVKMITGHRGNQVEKEVNDFIETILDDYGYIEVQFLQLGTSGYSAFVKYGEPKKAKKP